MNVVIKDQIVQTVLHERIKMCELLKSEARAKIELISQYLSRNAGILNKDESCKNEELKAEIERLKSVMISKMNCDQRLLQPRKNLINKLASAVSTDEAPVLVRDEKISQAGKKVVTDKNLKTNNKKDDPKQTDDNAIFNQLDLRVGQIVNVEKHPDADSLYVEKVNFGDAIGQKTVISGLVNHIPIEDMRDRKAIFLVNLKPAKMRGILSEAMIMCASTPEKVEIVEVPQNSNIGDRVRTVVSESTESSNKQISKKIFEKVAPLLKIDPDGFAVFKDLVWNINGETCSAPTLKNVNIK